MEWISVNDALPEMGQEVLVSDNLNVSFGWYTDTDKCGNPMKGFNRLG